MSNDFYSKVKCFSTFNEVCNQENYTPLPDDWILVISDIKGSTDLVKQGRYKEVNMAGASIITALANHYKTIQLPYIFGGDGATICIPPDESELYKGVLSYCKNSIRKAYGFDIIIGVISIKELREAGHDLLVARQKLSEWVEQAVFWGSGLQYAEIMLKNGELNPVETAPVVADFNGLKCRWNIVPSKHDEIVALIIQANKTANEQIEGVYKACMERIEKIYGADEQHRPISTDQLKLESSPSQLITELKIRTHSKGFWYGFKYFIHLYFMQLAGYWLMKKNKKTSGNDWGRYKKDLVLNSDYRKFNYSIQTIMSGTIEQRVELTEYLEKEFKAGNLVYGIHSSYGALITCFVRNYQGNHVHFIDCSDGGYSEASKALKIRLEYLQNHN
jgi:hypothetical protein